MREPIRIVTKNAIHSLSAAAALLGTLNASDMRCSLRVIPSYTKSELDALLHEEYPSFILIDCTEEEFHARLEARPVKFLSSSEVYSEAFILSEKARDFAHIAVMGIIAAAHEKKMPIIMPDTLLQDALSTRMLAPEKEDTIMDLSENFLQSLTVPFNGTKKKVIELAGMVTAAARMGKATTAVAAMLNDTAAQDKLFRIWGEYRRELDAALTWCKQHEKETHKYTGVSIIHLKDYVAPYLTGSIAAHIVAEAPQNTLVLVMAYAPDKRIRVSLRTAAQKDKSMMLLLREIFEGINGECGGDAHAAGGNFARTEEEMFLNNARKVLEKAFVEESV
ncbi:MAG TPA: DHH family phosphoesterase [Candidatus Nanoarchaeia archaeon]|nr:DHH family phosphoesterase [Candidatus Nanoarchaeia archaeon]